MGAESLEFSIYLVNLAVKASDWHYIVVAKDVYSCKLKLRGGGPAFVG